LINLNNKNSHLDRLNENSYFALEVEKQKNFLFLSLQKPQLFTIFCSFFQPILGYNGVQPNTFTLCITMEVLW
jgi:hypothetical protein